MLIIDAHLDLAWNALQFNRDLLQSVYTLRTREARMQGPGRGQNTVSFPEMRRGRIALAFGTVLARVNPFGSPEIDYGSPAQAFAAARGHLSYYHALAGRHAERTSSKERDDLQSRQGHIRLITNRAQLDAHLREWELFDETTSALTSIAPPTGIVISMECADPILSPAQVQDWFDVGLRAIGPAHYGNNRYVGGTGTSNGFNDAGIDLLRAMEHAGMILDVTHLSDEAFWEAMSLYDGAMIASHHNCRALVPHQRQLSDEQIRALIQRDAVIGAAFDVWMLIPEWSFGRVTNRAASIATVAEHIDHVCQLAGDSLHAAIGSDLDGGFGREASPYDLDTIADVQNIADALAARDFDDDDITNVMHANWLRVLRGAWKE